jgi:aromatic ring-cleaving dioxygenase
MSDDLDFLVARVPGYGAYGEEEQRHDSDMRVRAFVGERLSTAQVRLGALDESVQKAFDAVMLRCMFTDQAFIKRFEHLRLDAAQVATLVHADRRLVELGERLNAVSAADLIALVNQIGAQIDERDSPALLTAPFDKLRVTSPSTSSGP